MKFCKLLPAVIGAMVLLGALTGGCVGQGVFNQQPDVETGLQGTDVQWNLRRRQSVCSQP